MPTKTLIIASKNYLRGMVKVETTLQLLKCHLNEIKIEDVKCGQQSEAP